MYTIIHRVLKGGICVEKLIRTHKIHIEGMSCINCQIKIEKKLKKTIGILIIVVCLYILLIQTGVLNLLVPSQLADSKMGYGMLFVIGLLTSVHCIAMCGGINLSQCLNEKEKKENRLATFKSTFL